MAKLKLTKTELKTQRDSLQRFLRFLPTLELKKKQLIQEIGRVESLFERLTADEAAERTALSPWRGLLTEPAGLEKAVTLVRVETAEANIAGVTIPVFVKAVFSTAPYDLMTTPLWLDRAVEVIQRLGSIKAERAIVVQQRELLGRELRVTIQRINLFDKVKVPEARDFIRRIQICLGDQQANAVARGKIAKGKLADVQMESFA